MQNWYVYLIRCGDGSLYTGIATDVDRRFAEHQQGSPSGAKYLRGRSPLMLVFREKIGSRSLASQVEIMIKKLPKSRKESLLSDGYRPGTIVKRFQSANAPAPPNGRTGKPIVGLSL